MKISVIFALIALLGSTGTWAQYRCIEDGKTVFTDKPCATQSAPKAPTGNSPKVIGDSGNSAYASSYGDWRGQVQYQASQNGNPISEAHTVVQTTVSIDPQGKIVGASPENGCMMKGIAASGPIPTILNLDITLSDCKYRDLNRRFSGTLTVYPARQQAQFWIYAMPVGLLKPGRSFDVKGTMRR